jgi:hypothetical protein
MNETDHFKVFVLCSDDVTADVYHVYIREFTSGFLLYSYRGFNGIC